jgi:tRNA A37 threonylcarbamoyladenosine dehydratase
MPTNALIGRERNSHLQTAVSSIDSERDAQNIYIFWPDFSLNFFKEAFVYIVDACRRIEHFNNNSGIATSRS